jgi:predicted DNA-binding transcriptional regulator YafY
MSIEQKASLLKECGLANLKVWMTYHGEKSQIESRFVWPMGWRQTNIGVLLYGFCELHGRIHSFRLERIRELQKTTHTFDPGGYQKTF